MGEPKQKTYFELYDHSATAVKKVSPRLRVGGPATAQAAWADAFIQHCAQAHVPVDFISSHVYGNDSAHDVFGTNENIGREQMVCRAVKKVHDQMKASAMPQLPLIWSEFNASYKNEPEVTDSTYMGPWLADTIRQCDGLVNEMSYWTFSDVFEEQGVVKEPFYGGYGLIAIRGIPKPAFNAFKVLHHLGTERLAVHSDSALVTRKPDGSLQVAIWSFQPPGAEREERLCRALPCEQANGSARVDGGRTPWRFSRDLQEHGITTLSQRAADRTAAQRGRLAGSVTRKGSKHRPGVEGPRVWVSVGRGEVAPAGWRRLPGEDTWAYMGFGFVGAGVSPARGSMAVWRHCRRSQGLAGWRRLPR